MAQFYSDPAREKEEHALPDCEVFYADTGELTFVHPEPSNETSEPGFYWWYCLPGCLPDGDPVGPFETEQEAIDACREENAE